MNDRDTFAAAALAGLIACMKEETLEEICESAYGWADAMLRERGAAVSDNCVTGNQREMECPVTAMPKEKRAEVSCTTHDAAPAAKATADRYVRRAAADGDSDRTDKAAPRPSEGTGNTPIDVEELLGELHFIAGSEDSVEYDIRRTACKAEHAIDRLRAWVNELQLSRAEIDALQHVVEDGRFVDLGDYGRLRSLLVRLRPEWEDEAEDHSRNGALSGCETVPDPDSRVWETQRTPQQHHAPPQCSVPGECSVPRSGTENEPVAWAVMDQDGFGFELAFTDHAQAVKWCGNRQQIVPLYRSPPLTHPTLTDEEREAVEVTYSRLTADSHYAAVAATLRGLLDRTAATHATPAQASTPDWCTVQNDGSESQRRGGDDE